MFDSCKGIMLWWVTGVYINTAVRGVIFANIMIHVTYWYTKGRNWYNTDSLWVKTYYLCLSYVCVKTYDFAEVAGDAAVQPGDCRAVDREESVVAHALVVGDPQGV